VVAATLPVFSAPTEERLKEMAQELGYGIRRATDRERPSEARDGIEPGKGSPADDDRRP